LKPKSFQNPQTPGQHLRARRHDLGQYLREAAIPLGVTPSTLMNWEKGHSKPEMQNWPAIIAYLGYDPFSDRKRPVKAAGAMA
jgi:DNA-binding XRE family transcriptional regulator